MTRISPALAFWLILIAGFAFVLFVLADILTPFLLALAIAYLLDPMVSRMQRSGVNRGVASFSIIIALSLMLFAAVAVILPALVNQISQLIQSLPAYWDTARAYIEANWYHWLEPLREHLRLPAPAPGDPRPQVIPERLTETAVPWLAGQLQSMLTGGLAWVQSLIILFVTPVIAFFLLKDWPDMIAVIDRALPRKDAPTIRRLAVEIDNTVSNYLRGQLTVLLILSAFFMISLQLVGLNYGLLIGLIAGMISFVPYLGTFTGFVLSGSVAFLQFYPDWASIMTVVSIFVVGQIVESNVLTPKIVGDRVRLHPVWLIFALFAFGYLFGFTGLIVAVPLAAVIGVLVRYAMGRYYESPVYAPENATRPEARKKPAAEPARQDVLHE